MTTNTPADVNAEAKSALKLSVNVSAAIGQRLRRVAFEERLSESSIVEIALNVLFEQMAPEALGPFLRGQGASLRRGAER